MPLPRSAWLRSAVPFPLANSPSERPGADDPWAGLETELARWPAGTATFWWRDDDATAPSPALDRLLGLADKYAVPLALAVIPAPVQPALAARVAKAGDVAVLQHGWSHDNHAPDGQRACELDDAWPAEELRRDLPSGWRRLQALFGDRAAPVLVPPWNRIGGRAVRRVTDTGLYAALSGLGPRPWPGADGLPQVNVHVDVMNWQTRRFAGDQPVLAAVVEHLTARRTGGAESAEPTGLMTHHLFHDEETWNFLDRFVAETARHTAVRWCTVRDVVEGCA